MNSREEETPQGNDLRLSMLNFYQDQLKLTREIMDRWFGYYLLIIGGPLPVLGGLLQVETIRQSITSRPVYIAVIAFFLFSVGLLFLLMNSRQRINAIEFVKIIIPMRRLMVEELFRGLLDIPPESGIQRFGADLYFGLVYILINSFWFAAGVYLLGLSWIPRYAWVLWISGLAISFLLQCIWRCSKLRTHEMASNNG